mmetsp:Transcript_4556/g.9432  ORF Transcript_4556/g.9432 Transcript_4556/m.9432 type:complete len:131 (-) Transcript_4556:1130-1522(-)
MAVTLIHPLMNLPLQALMVVEKKKDFHSRRHFTPTLPPLRLQFWATVEQCLNRQLGVALKENLKVFCMDIWLKHWKEYHQENEKQNQWIISLQIRTMATELQMMLVAFLKHNANKGSECAQIISAANVVN